MGLIAKFAWIALPLLAGSGVLPQVSSQGTGTIPGGKASSGSTRSLNLLKINISPNGARELESVLRNEVSRFQVPGAVVAYGQGNQVSAIACVGVRQYGLNSQATSSDPFVYGSMTQFVLGTLTARLVDQGVIGWKDNLGNIFPELSAAMPSIYKNATIYDLATCSSGLPGGMNFDEMNRRWNLPPEKARYELLKNYLLNLPPTAVGPNVDSHGGPNWYALATAIERKSRSCLEKLMQDELIAPLALEKFGFDIPESSQGLFGFGGHVRDRGSVVASKFIFRSRVSFYGSAIDLLKICQANLPSAKGGSGYISDENIRVLHTKSSKSPFCPAGRVSGSSVIFMAGDTGSEYGQIMINTSSGQMIAGFMNLRSSDGGQQAIESIFPHFFR